MRGIPITSYIAVLFVVFGIILLVSSQWDDAIRIGKIYGATKNYESNPYAFLVLVYIATIALVVLNINRIINIVAKFKNRRNKK